MGKLNRMILAAALFGACAAACTEKSPAPASPQELEAIPRAKAAIRAPEPDPRLDAEGRLKTSGLKMSWLEIPISFIRRPGSTERDASYEADGLNIDQVRDYVLSRVLPDRIEKRQNGEAYLRSKPLHTGLPMAPLNITVLETDPSKRLIRLSIEDLAPTAPPFENPAQAAAALEAMRARAK